MTSQRQIASNRENAEKSTGPKSRRGKSRSRLNAMKHGLASVILEGSQEDEEVNKIAHALLGPSNQNPAAIFYAREAAEAEQTLRRVRSIKVEFFNTLENESQFVPEFPHQTDDSILLSISELLEKSIKLDRYERRARSRRKKALRYLMEALH